MALPTLEKTYDFQVNRTYSDVADVANQKQVFETKDAITSLASGTWVVKASSDGTIADTNDNWGAYTDLNYATTGSAHSWIILQNTASNIELCFDCNTTFTTSENTRMIVAPTGGFSTVGLVTTDIPTPPADAFGWCPGATRG